MLWEREAFML
jgi:hypothetical protein